MRYLNPVNSALLRVKTVLFHKRDSQAGQMLSIACFRECSICLDVVQHPGIRQE